MSLIDFILNLVGLLLWIDWRSGSVLARPAAPQVTIANSLKPADPINFRPWISLTALMVMLLLRAVFYWNIGNALNWAAAIDLGPLVLSWRSDLLSRMLIYSFVSFGLVLFVLFCCLFLLSALQPNPLDQPFSRFIKVQLGWPDRLPAWLKILLPFLIGALAWAAATPWLSANGLILRPKSTSHLWQQAAVLGLSSYLVWRWFLIAVFALHMLNTYVYLGEHPFWKYITHVSLKLLSPLSFLRFKKMDLSPVAGIILVFVLAELGLQHFVLHIFHRLPL